MSNEYGQGGYAVGGSLGGSLGGSASGSMGTSSTNVSFGSQPATQQAPQQSPNAPGGPAVKDITTASFMQDVIEASKAAPVIVDFWAPWCGPCKQLGPIIEKLVTASNGAVSLCKMDIDKYPEVAGQMGVQSIPAVVAFIDGRPADAFMGAKPESEVKAFIDKVAAKGPGPQASPIDTLLEQADSLLKAADYGGAAEIFSHILSTEAGNLDALAGLGQCFLAVGEAERAKNLLAHVPEEHREKELLLGLVKALDLAEKAASLGDLEPLAKAVEADPTDHQARFDYAVALNGNGQRHDAIENLIAIVKADREWNDDGARKQLLEFFESWGPMDEASVAGRRALSSVLFS
ncbi:MAG: thioredoxin [Pseudomonadota bacterium]